jgi:hypothetical protein
VFVEKHAAIKAHSALQKQRSTFYLFMWIE